MGCCMGCCIPKPPAEENDFGLREVTSEDPGMLVGNTSTCSTTFSSDEPEFEPFTPEQVAAAFEANRTKPFSYARPPDVLVKDTNIVEKCKTADGFTCVNQYIVMKTVGKGMYCKVKRCIDITSGQNYALKICNKKELRRKSKMGVGGSTLLDDVRKEISILRQLNHKNIVTLHEVIEEPTSDKLYIVLEYTRGAPMKAIVKQEPLDLQDARKHFRDTVEGLEYLHYKRVIHRDIKPQNLLIGLHHDETHVKIADFGVSSVLASSDDMLRSTEGSPAFMAPEVCQGGQFFGPPVDVWALGITLFVFIFGEIPFRSEQQYGIYDVIKNSELTFPFPTEAALTNLLRRLLEKDPVKRITIAEIKQHPWVTMNGVCPMEDVAFSDEPLSPNQIYKAVDRPYQIHPAGVRRMASGTVGMDALRRCGSSNCDVNSGLMEADTPPPRSLATASHSRVDVTAAAVAGAVLCAAGSDYTRSRSDDEDAVFGIDDCLMVDGDGGAAQFDRFGRRARRKPVSSYSCDCDHGDGDGGDVGQHNHVEGCMHSGGSEEPIGPPMMNGGGGHVADAQASGDAGGDDGGGVCLDDHVHDGDGVTAAAAPATRDPFGRKPRRVVAQSNHIHGRSRSRSHSHSHSENVNVNDDAPCVNETGGAEPAAMASATAGATAADPSPATGATRRDPFGRKPRHARHNANDVDHVASSHGHHEHPHHPHEQNHVPHPHHHQQVLHQQHHHEHGDDDNTQTPPTHTTIAQPQHQQENHAPDDGAHNRPAAHLPDGPATVAPVIIGDKHAPQTEAAEPVLPVVALAVPTAAPGTADSTDGDFSARADTLLSGRTLSSECSVGVPVVPTGESSALPLPAPPM